MNDCLAESQMPQVGWIDALRRYNLGGSAWCIPRKGTPEYEKVMMIRRGDEDVKPQPRKRTVKAVLPKEEAESKPEPEVVVPTTEAEVVVPVVLTEKELEAKIAELDKRVKQMRKDYPEIQATQRRKLRYLKAVTSAWKTKISALMKRKKNPLTEDRAIEELRQTHPKLEADVIKATAEHQEAKRAELESYHGVDRVADESNALSKELRERKEMRKK
jgi:hypothetical protein